MPTTDLQRGVTLIELLLAVAISAILLAALNGLVKLGLDAQASVRGSNELSYQGRFALERISDAARATTPHTLTTTPAANTTGDWLSPRMYCVNASQLIETYTYDPGCASTAVVATHVSALSAQLPDTMGPIDRQVGVISLTLSSGSATLTLSSSVRLGGGTQ